MVIFILFLFLQQADESLNFEEQILEAAKAIANATSALVKAASAAQRELVDQGMVGWHFGIMGQFSPFSLKFVKRYSMNSWKSNNLWTFYVGCMCFFS